MNAETIGSNLLLDSESGPSDLGALDAASVLEVLFRRARDHLTTDELKWLALDATSHADELSRRAGEVLNGLGCMVQADDGGAGNFQSKHDIPTLLFHFASVFEQVSGLVRLAGDAADMLEPR